jgi:hypothetical protein
MRNIEPAKPFSKGAFGAFLIAIFLLFTPFEEAGANATMFPKYFAAGASLLLLVPLLFITKVQFRRASLFVSLVLLALTFHMLIVEPTPTQFVMLVVANVSLAIVAYEARFLYRAEFEAALACLLLVNAFAIVVQTALFYFVNSTIYDLHALIFGSASRTAEDFLNIARFTGIHVEPGTYTNYVSCMLAIYVFSCDFSKKVFRIAVTSLFTVLLTHSASAVFFVAALLLILGWIWRDRIGLHHLLVLLTAIVAYSYASDFIAHLQMRFLAGDDGSLSLKVLGVNTYKQASLEEKLIGFGFGKDPCSACHYQDIGVMLNLLSRGGIIIALTLIPILLRSFRLHGLLFTVLLFSVPVYCIMSFYEAPIWLFILFAISGENIAKRDMPLAPIAPALPRQTGLVFAGRGPRTTNKHFQSRPAPGSRDSHGTDES